MVGRPRISPTGRARSHPSRPRPGWRAPDASGAPVGAPDVSCGSVGGCRQLTMTVRLQQGGTAVLVGTTAHAVTSTESPRPDGHGSTCTTGSSCPRFGFSAKGPIVGGATVSAAPPLTRTVTLDVLRDPDRTHRERAHVRDPGRDPGCSCGRPSVPMCFGPREDRQRSGRVADGPQLFSGCSSPSWFAHTDTTIASPACSPAVPWFHISVKLVGLVPRERHVFAASRTPRPGPGHRCG